MQQVFTYLGESSIRIDAFLQTVLPHTTRSFIQAAIKNSQVMINQTLVEKSSHILKKNQVVTYTPTNIQIDVSHIIPTTIPLPILYEDADCMVLQKPAGYAVHPGHSMNPDEITILHGIHALFIEKKIPFVPASVLVHRLDKDTTGCLLIAKNPHAHVMLQRQFKDRSVSKLYIALVAGIPTRAKARIEASIGRSTSDRTKMSVSSSTSARTAITEYELLSSSIKPDIALLKCTLLTGRTHQIRVHLHSIGHPIIGDVQYKNAQSESITKECAVQSICLHAWQLTFSSDGTEQTVFAPLPVEFKVACANGQIVLPTRFL